jgi:hypothetical protein
MPWNMTLEHILPPIRPYTLAFCFQFVPMTHQEAECSPGPHSLVQNSQLQFWLKYNNSNPEGEFVHL